MSYSTPTSALRPVRIRSALRSSLPAVLALTILGALVGLGCGLLLPVKWAATTSVLIRPLTGNPYNPSTQGTSLTNLETEAQLAESEEISSAVITRLGLGLRPSVLAGRTSVAIESNTQIIRVTYTSPHKSGVERVSGAIAQSFLDYRSARRDKAVHDQKTVLDKQIAAVESQISRLQKSRGGPPSTEQRQALGGQLLNLRVQAANLASTSGTPGEVIVRPAAHRAGLALPWWALVAAGALIGLLIGLVYALFRERRSDLIRTEEELSDFDVLVIGQPASRPGRRSLQPVGTADVARDVATVLRQSATAPASLAITGAEGPSGRNSLPEDVAAVLAPLRGGVLVIDAVSTVGSKEEGLCDLLLDEDKKLRDVVTETGEGVAFLSVGTDPRPLPALFSTSRFQSVLAQALSGYEWVLLHAPSAATTSGRSLLGSCDYWVSVVTLGESRARETAQVIRSAESLAAELLGVVVARPARRSGRGPRSPRRRR